MAQSPRKSPAQKPAAVAQSADPAGSHTVAADTIALAATVSADAPAAPTPAAAAAPTAVPVASSISSLIAAIAENGDIASRAGLSVTGPVAGRRRAGRVFGREAVVIALTELSPADLLAIDGDALLTWAIVPMIEDDDET